MVARRRKKTWLYLFSATGSVLLVALAAFTAVSIFAMRKTAYRQTEGNLRQFSYAVSHFLDAEPDRLTPEKLQAFCAHFAAGTEFRISYIRSDGTVVADSAADPSTLENHLNRPEIAAALGGSEGSAIRYSTSLRERMVYYAIPYRKDAIRLSISINYVDTASQQIVIIILIAAFLILAVTVGVSVLVARRISRPLGILESAAYSYAGGSLDFEFDDGKFPQEFSELAETFALMAAKLREKIVALDGQNRETEAILASMNDALIVLDGNGLVARINRAAEKLFSVPSEEAVGMPLIQAVRNTDIVDFALSPQKGETERTIELRTAAKTGSRFVLAQSSSIEGRSDRLLVFGDITQLKNLERIRKDFVANVSHELKTPVTSIQGFIETLKDGALADPVASKRFLGIMEQQSIRLSAIINDLLAISRLEQGDRTAIARQETSIATLLESVRNLCEEEAAKKKTRLRFTAAEIPPCSVNAGLLEQAITNLVLNAIKYSPEKATVSIDSRLDESSDPDKKHLVVRVEDNGIGIPDKDLSRIFERFYRVDKGRSRENGGTGLGLSIVRHIALAHGGSVSVESVEGEGSAFTLDIPV